jgi:hypothetical protein
VAEQLGHLTLGDLIPAVISEAVALLNPRRGRPVLSFGQCLTHLSASLVDLIGDIFGRA